MTQLRIALCVFAFIWPLRTTVPQEIPEKNTCERTLIPLAAPPELKLKVVKHFLTFSPQAEGTLFLKNETGSPINGITLQVNYTDSQRKHIFTITYQADVEPGVSPRLDIRPFFRGILTKPVRPGQIFNLFGTNLLATTELPTNAEISVSDLRLANLGINNQHPGTFESDPILERARTKYIQLAAGADDGSGDVLLRLNISATGIVTDVAITRRETRTREQTLGSVVDEIRKWRFFPAIRDGFGVRSELFLLLRFRSATEPAVRECFIGEADKYPKTFAIVTLEPVPNLTERWTFFYGRYEISYPFLSQQAFITTPRGR